SSLHPEVRRRVGHRLVREHGFALAPHRQLAQCLVGLLESSEQALLCRKLCSHRLQKPASFGPGKREAIKLGGDGLHLFIALRNTAVLFISLRSLDLDERLTACARRFHLLCKSISSYRHCCHRS